MSVFKFKHFDVRQGRSALKVGTDAMVLGALVKTSNKVNALDVGSGTGVLALMLAQKNSNIKVTAIELDENSCLDAAENFETSPYANRLNLLNQDFLSFKQTGFDLIVCNPPYYENGLLGEDNRVNTAKHVDQLTPERLTENAASCLSDVGQFWVIWPFESSLKFVTQANNSGLYLREQIIVFGKPNQPKRVVLCFEKLESSSLIESTFCIREASGDYTSDYKLLTREFHFNTL